MLPHSPATRAEFQLLIARHKKTVDLNPAPPLSFTASNTSEVSNTEVFPLQSNIIFRNAKRSLFLLYKMISEVNLL